MNNPINNNYGAKIGNFFYQMEAENKLIVKFIAIDDLYRN